VGRSRTSSTLGLSHTSSILGRSRMSSTLCLSRTSSTVDWSLLSSVLKCSMYCVQFELSNIIYYHRWCCCCCIPLCLSNYLLVASVSLSCRVFVLPPCPSYIFCRSPNWFAWFLLDVIDEILVFKLASAKSLFNHHQLITSLPRGVTSRR
jgi:hypothetical protein